MDDLEQMMEFKTQGFSCSQVILKMALEMQGKENPDLIRAMQGLAGGLGYTGDVCGGLTGAVCMLGLYAGRGLPEEEDEPRLMFMIEDLLKWFKQEYGVPCGGIHCENLVGQDRKKVAEICPNLIAATYQRAKELLVENGFDLSASDR